jgi:hypothetical protein
MNYNSQNEFCAAISVVLPYRIPLALDYTDVMDFTGLLKRIAERHVVSEQMMQMTDAKLFNDAFLTGQVESTEHYHEWRRCKGWPAVCLKVACTHAPGQNGENQGQTQPG